MKMPEPTRTLTFDLFDEREPFVQVYAPLGEGDALYRVYRGLDAAVPLDCIGCELKLSEVYRRTKFKDAD